MAGVAKRLGPLIGSMTVPGDKSISHRALLIAALARGTSEIQNLAPGEDVRSTVVALRQLGVPIEVDGNKAIVSGGKLYCRKPINIDCGNSGTTMRLLAGVLAGIPGNFRLYGDKSLSRRPMRRIADPLKALCADIELTNNDYSPITIGGKALVGRHISLDIPSAQVKSALLYAGALAKGSTTIAGALASRDHTERLFPHFGVQIQNASGSLRIEGGQQFHANNLQVPGDFSSAAFFITAAALVKNSNLMVRNVGLNPTRIGLLTVLQRMGGNVEVVVRRLSPEPVGDVRVQYAPLRGTIVEASEIPKLIDEVPLIALLGAQADGETIVKGASELRFKETDRIAAVKQNLSNLGLKIRVSEDGFSISGPQPIYGGCGQSFDDHRMAMLLAVAGRISREPIAINNSQCVSISYPQFFSEFERMTHDARA